MKKIMILIMIALLFAGCATTAPTQKVTTTQSHKPYTGTYAPDDLLGDRLGCAKKQVEYGYTKEGCGELWGKEIWIDWGGVQ